MEFLDTRAVESSDEGSSKSDNEGERNERSESDDEGERNEQSDKESQGKGGESSSSDVDERKKKVKKKKSKKVKHLIETDDEEEEEEEEEDEEVQKELAEFIDDNPEDAAEEEASSGEEEGKRKRDDSELEEDLEEDDYDLIEENIGIKLNRKKKHKRIRMQSDEEDESEKEGQQDEREVIAREIFEGDEEDDAASEIDREEPVTVPERQVSDEDEESDIDDFIVDEEGRPISRVKKKKHIIHDDAALQEAQDIFGVDFDFDEFEKYGDDLADEDEEEDEEDEMEGERQVKTAKKRRKTKKATIYEVFEPVELERSHLTDIDQEIRQADTPERFQLRGIPVCAPEEGELAEEAEWIYKQAFMTPPLLQRDTGDYHKPRTAVGKIREALKLMREQQFEVPFIAFYRKEYVDPELNINDLWRIFQWDEKWLQLKSRRQNLTRLLENMQQFQFELVDPDKPLDAHVRTLTDLDIERCRHVQTMEELHDVYEHFLLYYGQDIVRMKQWLRAKRQKQREAQEANGEEVPAEAPEPELFKYANRRSGYTMCVNAGLSDFARRFGLSAEQFAENLRDNYSKHDVEQDPQPASELAKDFIGSQFKTVAEVLSGARHMVAMQIAHEPVVRHVVREALIDRLKISCTPTKKGFKDIDEAHPCYTFRYLINKPVQTMFAEQYTYIYQAEKDGLLTYELHIDHKNDKMKLPTYFDEIQQLFQRDEYSHLVTEWNNERSQALERALNQLLYPQLIKELKGRLLEEAKDTIVKMSCHKLYDWLKVAPYQVDQPIDDDDLDISKGVRVLGVSHSTERDVASYCALVDGDGEMSDFMKLQHLTTRRTTPLRIEREAKEAEIKKLKDFIATKKPQVIAVGAENRETLSVIEELKQIVNELEQEQQISPINIELVQTDIAKIFAASKRAEHDMREYPLLLRQAVCLARRLQDPLIEFAQLCNSDDDISCLKVHTLQDVVSKEELQNALYLEFVNRVNEVGVDVNRCVAHAHTAPLVQFVCGLGPRKGYQLLKILKQNSSRLENRTQLVTVCRMGPKVFINCAGFIKIDTAALGDSAEAYVEVLDGSRVHPETYEWARKMAVDALEYDDTAEGANPAGALEEILESPERLKDLDLDAFAEELERQGYGDRHITLYDIRAELNQRYKDLRTPFRPLNAEEQFYLLTHEMPSTFHRGKLITCRVIGTARRRPNRDQLDQANPVRNDKTGLWQCPFCQKDDFPELSEVWNHFDAGECVGQPVGVRTRLDNGVSGFINLKNLSDKTVTNPEERVKVGMMLHCRIVKVDVERFQADLTSRTSDLADARYIWRLPRDQYYNHDAEERETKKEEDRKKNLNKQTYTRRVITHSAFKNIDYKGCERLMDGMDQGEVIIRPSSKSINHLTATWKVADNILQHLDIREEGKKNAFSLGQSLFIGLEEFEDLDEIIARHIQPMAAFARDLLAFKYYKDAEGGKKDVLEKLVVEEKKKMPARIPYYFSASQQYPGKFLLCYIPRKTPITEFVTITPQGLRYRNQIFHSPHSLIRWFKEHFRDPVSATPVATLGRTPVAGMMATPHMDMQRMTPGSVFMGTPTPYGQTPVAYNQTPAPYGQTPFGAVPTGWQAANRTPMMTPSQTYKTPSQPYMTPMQSARLGTPSQKGAASAQMGPPQTPRGNWVQASQMPPPQQSARQGTVSGVRPNVQQVAAGGVRPNVQQQNVQRMGSSDPQDWAKMAQIWAKRKQIEQRQRPQQSPSSRSPAFALVRDSPASPTGDATPLIDER